MCKCLFIRSRYLYHEEDDEEDEEADTSSSDPMKKRNMEKRCLNPKMKLPPPKNPKLKLKL